MKNPIVGEGEFSCDNEICHLTLVNVVITRNWISFDWMEYEGGHLEGASLDGFLYEGNFFDRGNSKKIPDGTFKLHCLPFKEDTFLFGNYHRKDRRESTWNLKIPGFPDNVISAWAEKSEN